MEAPAEMCVRDSFES